MLTNLDLSQKAVLCKNILIENLEEESVLLNLDTLIYISQDDVGTRMFYLLIESASIEEAYQVLKSEYEVEESLLERDLLGHLQKLIEQNIVKLEESSPS